MFKKSLIKRNLNESVEGSIVDQAVHNGVYKKINSRADVIRPVVFTSGGICGNYQPYMEPLEIFTQINLSAQNNADIALNPLSKSLLYRLGNNNFDIMVNLMENYIIQQSFLSFCGYLDTKTELASVLQYLNIKGNLSEYLFDSKHYNYIDTMLRGLYYSDKNIKPEQLKVLATHIAYQISTIISSLYSKAVDAAVNEVFLSIYYAPNLKQLVEELVSKNASLKCIAKETPNNLNMCCAIFVKEYIFDDTFPEFFKIVIDSINDALIASLNTGYDMFFNILMEKYPDEKGNDYYYDF